MTTSKKPVVGGVRFRTPLLLLLVVLVVTCFARARPVEATNRFTAFCYDDLKDGTFKEYVKKRDLPEKYGTKFNYDATKARCRVGSSKIKTINLKERCAGENSPYRYWFWFSVNRHLEAGSLNPSETLHTKSGHGNPYCWRTDYFYATTNPLTGSKLGGDLAGYGYDYNALQYKKSGDAIRLEAYTPLASGKKNNNLVNTLGTTTADKYGTDFYLIDLKEWFEKSDSIADRFEGEIYLQTVPLILDSDFNVVGKNLTTLKSWLNKVDGYLSATGMHDYVNHYNQKIEIKLKFHRLYMYRMHTSEEHPVTGKMEGTRDGGPERSCRFSGKNSKIGKLEYSSGTAFILDPSKFRTYKDGDKTYYLKGIREEYWDQQKSEWCHYAKFQMTDSLTQNPVVGTDKETTEYAKKSEPSMTYKRDTMSGKIQAWSRRDRLTLDSSGKVEVKKGSDKSGGGANDSGLSGKKTWSEIADYMLNQTWKNGIKNNRLILLYQEIPKGKVQVYNKVYEYDDELGIHKCVSGESTPVYTRELKGGSKAVSIKLETENQKSKSVKSLRKTGCAPVSVLRRNVNYYPKWIHASYYDMDNKKHTVEYNISDYVYNSSKKSVRKKPSGFKDTANEKCYAGVSSGHAKAEEAFTAITKYVISHANLTGVNPSGDVMFSISYYQPKVPNVLLKYYRYYDEKGKPVDTLVSKETLDNTCINSTSKKDNYLGFAYYYTDIGIGKDSKGKWTVITDSNRDKLTDLKWNTPLVSEAAYNSNVKDYHGATTNSWESKKGLTTKRGSKVDKKYSSGMHSIWYQTGVKGNAVKLIYGEKKASYTINIYRGESNSEVKSVDQIDWTLGNTITQSVNTTDKRESIRTVFVKIMDTLEGTGVTAVNLSSYKLQRQLTWAENEELITAGPPKERDGSQTTIVWPKDSTESVVLNLYYVSKVGGPDDPPDNPGDPPKDPPGTSKTTTTLEWDDLKNPMGTEHEPSEDSSHDNCSISGVVQKDNVSTVSAVDDSANAEVGGDLILPNGKMDWTTGKYVPNTLKTGSKTTAYLSKGVIKKHNVTTQFTVDTFRDIYRHYVRSHVDKDGNIVDDSYDSYDGRQTAKFNIVVKTVYFEMKGVEVWSPENSNVYSYAFPNSEDGNTTEIDSDGNCRSALIKEFGDKDYFTRLVKQIKDWGSSDWGKVTFGKAKCIINAAGLSGLIFQAPSETIGEFSSWPSAADMISTVHAELPGIISANWDVKSDVLEFRHPDWEEGCAGKYDVRLQENDYGIKVITSASSSAPGSVNNYDGLNNSTAEDWRILRGEQSVNKLFSIDGIRIDQSKLNTKDTMSGPEKETKVSIHYKKFGTNVGNSQEEGWIYSRSANGVVLHTPIAISTSIKKYAKDRVQSVIDHGSNEPITLGTPFTMSLDYSGDFSSMGYGKPNTKIDTHEFVLEDDTAYFTFPFPCYTTIDNGDAVFRKANKIFKVSGVSRTVFYPAYWAKEATHEIRTEVESLNVIGQDAMKSIENRQIRTCVNLNVLRDFYRPYYDKAIDVTGILTDLRITDIGDYPALQGVFRKDGKNGTSKYDRTGYAIYCGTKNFLGTDRGEQTYPIVNGDRLKDTKYGVFKPGYKVRFNVTTISSLQGRGDDIHIKPTFSWVPKSTLSNPNPTPIDVKVYYDENVNGTNKKLVEVGSIEDLYNKHSLSIGDKENNCKLQDLQDTAKLMDYSSAEQLMGDAKNSWSYGDVFIPGIMKVSEGEHNKDILSMASDGKTLPLEGNVDRETLNNCLQNWYGEYYLPNNLHVRLIDDNSNAAFANDAKYGYSYDEKYWVKDGYLKVNFKVMARKSGVNSLAYNAIADTNNDSLCDMWKLENRRETKPDNRGQKFSFIEGDFILYDLDRSMSDDYQSGGTH